MRTTIRSRFHGLLCIVLLLLLVAGTTDAGRGGSSKPVDAYSILGVSRTCTQNEIRRQYRKLCLTYHPDKNQGHPRQKRREERFKQVQDAYSRIGTEQARQTYDLQRDVFSHQQRHRRPSSSRFHQPSYWDQMSSRTRSRTTYTRSRPSFAYRFPNSSSIPSFFGDIRRMHEEFARAYQHDRRSEDPSVHREVGDDAGKTTPRTVYVSMSDLYHGKTEVFVPPPSRFGSLLRQWRTAKKDGTLLRILYLSLVSTLSLWGRSRLLAIVAGVTSFVSSLPQQLQRDLRATHVTIPPGTPPGSVLYASHNDIPVHVQLHHNDSTDRFVQFRYTNDSQLHARIVITRHQAQRGCTLRTPLVGSIQLPPGLHDSSTLRISNKGWPRKKNGERDDLWVTVRVLPS